MARQARPRLFTGWATALVLLLPLAAASAGVMGRAPLPIPLAGAAVVSDGAFLYVIGGDEGTSRSEKALRYDPSSDTWSELCSCIPTWMPSSSLAGVWAGSAVLVVGFGDRILRYEPPQTEAQLFEARLPSPREGAAVVWDGHAMLIMGGRILRDGKPAEYTDEIVRFDPANDTTRVMSARLPSPRAFASATWDGYRAYLFDGEDDRGPITRILRYDPESDLVVFEDTQQRHGLTGSSAVWSDGWAYVFGGRSVYGPANDALRWDIGAGGISGWGFLGGQTGGGRWALGGALVGKSAYIVGGRDANGPLRTHVRIDLDVVNPDPPTLWAPPTSSPATARNPPTAPSPSIAPTVEASPSPTTTPTAGIHQVEPTGAPASTGSGWLAMDGSAWVTLAIAVVAAGWALFLYLGARRRRARLASGYARIDRLCEEDAPRERLLQESDRLRRELGANRIDERQYEMLQRYIERRSKALPQVSARRKD